MTFHRLSSDNAYSCRLASGLLRIRVRASVNLGSIPASEPLPFGTHVLHKGEPETLNP